MGLSLKAVDFALYIGNYAHFINAASELGQIYAEEDMIILVALLAK